MNSARGLDSRTFVIVPPPPGAAAGRRRRPAGRTSGSPAGTVPPPSGDGPGHRRRDGDDADTPWRSVPPGHARPPRSTRTVHATAAPVTDSDSPRLGATEAPGAPLPPEPRHRRRRRAAGAGPPAAESRGGINNAIMSRGAAGPPSRESGCRPPPRRHWHGHCDSLCHCHSVTDCLTRVSGAASLPWPIGIPRWHPLGPRLSRVEARESSTSSRHSSGIAIMSMAASSQTQRLSQTFAINGIKHKPALKPQLSGTKSKSKMAQGST